MRKINLILWAIPLVVALGGCTGGAGIFNARGGAVAGIDAAATPLDTATIQTQTLGPAPAGSAPATGRVIGAAPAATTAAPAATTAPATTAPATSESAADIGAAAAAALRAGTTATTAAAAAGGGAGGGADTAATPAPAAAPQSPEEAACLDEGGRWGKAGDTSAMACFRPMKDAGKACNKESDCDSQCLARSKTCAPFWPIFGCSDVIQNDGAVVSLCLN